jgi:hypothetical protein
MKHRVILVEILISIIFIFSSNAQQDDFPVLKGPYLGQKPPGMIPEIFLPGIVTTELNEHGAPTFSPDLSEMYWSPQYKEIKGGKILFMKITNSQWHAPKIAPFSEEFKNQNPFLSFDGKRLFFKSFRPIETDVYKNGAFWICERTPEGWSFPKPLGASVNSGSMGQQITEAKNRNLYYASDRSTGKGHWDIYRVKYKNGYYYEPENLGDAINTKLYDGTPYIAPDESYLIFHSLSRPDGHGGSDLYISFRTADDTWINAKNMDGVINTKEHELFPIVTPDGRYLFFVRNGDIYWVDAKIIEEFRPEELK